MNLLARVLDQREERLTQQDQADDLWLRERAGVDPEERRRSWRRWLRKELEKTLQWPSQAAARDRLIGQCIAELTTLARQLRGRGWLLDGAALAGHVRELLAPVAKAQRAGKVGDFWPYFRVAVRRYVETHADEIAAQARRSGADEAIQTMAGALAALGLGKAPQKAPSLTELVTDRAAEIAAQKASNQAADAVQQRLFV